MNEQAKLKRCLLSVAAGIAMAFAMQSASAMSLQQAYEAALQNDPAFRAARYSNDAGQEARVLGRSALLPQLSGNYSGSRNNSTLTEMNREFERKYISRSATVSVRQPVFALDALARYKQGVAQSEYASAQFASQQQEVILRVFGSYLEVLLKEDQLALAIAERDMYIEQNKVNERMFKKGEGTRTDMLETQSRLDLAEATVLEAKDALQSAKDVLEGVVGTEVTGLDHLRAGFHVTPADTKGYEEWKRVALDNNPDLQALTKGIEISRQEINKARSGHVPRLDVVGTYGKLASDTINTYNQDQVIRSIGFQLNVPLYNGGAVSAQTRQAQASHEKAKADLETQMDKTLVELRKNYNQVASSVPRNEALEKAVESARLLVTATEQSIKGGVRINLDLLNAKRQLVTAQRDLAQARYGYIMAALRLRAAAGVLSADDVKLMAAYFE